MSFDNPRRRLKLTTRITVFHIVLFTMLSVVSMLLITFITVGYLDHRIRLEFHDVARHLSDIADQTYETLARYNAQDRFTHLLNTIRSKGVYDTSKYSILLVDSRGRSFFDDPRTRSSVRALVQRASKQLHESDEALDFHFTDHPDKDNDLGRLQMIIHQDSSSNAAVEFDFYYNAANTQHLVIHQANLLSIRTFYTTKVMPLPGDERLYMIFIYFAKSESDFVLILNSALFFAAAVGVGLLLTFGTVFARTSLQPLKDLSSIVSTIHFERYNDRIPRPNIDDEVTHLVDSLNRMLANLQRAYDDQKRFTSDVSHELRIPLTIMIGYLDLIRRYGKDEGMLDEALSAIESEAVHMKNLTDSLLLLARLENNKIRPTAVEIDVDAWMERILSDARLLYENHVFSYTGIGETDHLPQIRSDENLLTQVMRCFIENSVKYSDPGTEIILSAKIHTSRLELQVTDHGFGIPKDRIAQLTRRFYRVEEDRSRESGGTGLGLAIADGIVKALRGEMTIDSTPGEGTTITILLPHQID